MKRLRKLLDTPSEDRGAALILVLFIVMVISLAGAALLTFSDTSIRTTVALRDQAGNAYNADGAAQVAIDSLSTGHGFTSHALFDNANNTTCFGPNTTSGTLNLPGFYPATSGSGTTSGSASVVCSADPASGVNGTVVPITGANRPVQAIMTLGRRAGEDGINVKALGNPGIFNVQGTVRSNSNIRVGSGKLQSTAAVTAYGACNGSIVSTPPKNCRTRANLPDPAYDFEPRYDTPTNAIPTYRDVPANVSESCPGGVVTFEPGYYDDAIALSDLMNGNGACGDSTWWFKPGTYYFDFHNNTKDPDVYRGSGTGGSSTANRWSIKRGNLVAGTPADINGDAIASPGASPTMPGSCRNPIKSVDAKGVQFIFGGESQLVLEGSANAEICGTYKETRPPIGVYGVRSGYAARTTTLTGTGSTPTSALKMSTVTSAGKFADPTRVIEQGESRGKGKSQGLSTWTKATATPETSTITVSGYAPPSAIPAGSIVKKATVRVRHGNSKKYGSTDALAVTFTPKGVTGSPPASPITLSPAPSLPNNAKLVIDSRVLSAARKPSPFATYVHDHGFTGADMAYAATLTHIGNENLDAIQIDITYVTPAFRSQDISTIASNCMRVKYPSNRSCAALSTSAGSDFSGAFYIQGTTYTPLAAIDLTLNNATQQVLRFGV
ncbi:MAG TPA: hypothetical protein VIJ15_12185, partial [Dermatophilaceae bacterium]